MLREYKEQIRVENAFRFLKDPVYADGIYLKKPHRVMALGYVFLMALLIYSLLQRRVRQNMLKEKEPIWTNGKKRTMEPTANTVLEILKSINIVLISTSSGVERAVADNQLDGRVLRLLRLAGFSERIYVKSKSVWHVNLDNYGQFYSSYFQRLGAECELLRTLPLSLSATKTRLGNSKRRWKKKNPVINRSLASNRMRLTGSKKNLASSSTIEVRKKMAEPGNKRINLARQAYLLMVNRTSLYARRHSILS